jgi:hypothetical protein
MERLHKVIDRHLFTVIRKYLEAKGVDTSELERSMRVIINRGIWNAGGQNKNQVMGDDAHIADMSSSGDADGQGSSQ